MEDDTANPYEPVPLAGAEVEELPHSTGWALWDYHTAIQERGGHLATMTPI